jgi:hypothetical protein
MARQPRIDLAGYTYHVINRASGSVPIFNTASDYKQFEVVLEEAKGILKIRLSIVVLALKHWLRLLNGSLRMQ